MSRPERQINRGSTTEIRTLRSRLETEIDVRVRRFRAERSETLSRAASQRSSVPLRLLHWGKLAGRRLTTRASTRAHSVGPGVALRAIVPLLRIQRSRDRTVVFTVSGRLDGENVRELCQLIDAEPPGTPVMVDLTDLVLADRDAIRYLRDCETGDRVVLRNCPEYVRVWMAVEENR